MSVLWIVESPRDSIGAISQKLIGNFPIRAFASLKSLGLIIKISKSDRPKLLIIDSAVCEEGELGRLKHLQLQLANVPLICIGPEAERDRILSAGYLFALDTLSAIDLTRLLRSSLRQGGEAKTQYFKIAFKTFELSPAQHRIICLVSGNEIELTPKETRILTTLAERPGVCHSRDDLKKVAWNGRKVSTRTIDSQVSRLRKTLAPFQIEIDNVYGGGYLLRD